MVKRFSPFFFFFFFEEKKELQKRMLASLFMEWRLLAWMVCGCSVFVWIGVVEGAIRGDEITSLPWWSPKSLPSKQYSGYLTVNKISHLHYWFVESENDPATDPVVLWLNGGPGCSSLDGFFYELGPFEFTDDGGLSLRPYRWNRFANMLFLEAPVGVGFSYSSTQDYNNTDDRTAVENLAALEAFFDGFSEFKSNSFYIAGESYAGIYIPTLAEAILQAVDGGTYTGAPLKGIAVGNGCTGYQIGTCAWQRSGICQGLYYRFQFLLELPFFNQTLKDEITAACDWNSCKNNQTVNADIHVLSSQCVILLNAATVQLGAVNIYNVYGTCVRDSCDGPEGATSLGRAGNLDDHLDSLDAMLSRLDDIVESNGMDVMSATDYASSKNRQLSLKFKSFNGTVRGPLGCIDSALATAYLTRADVMNAIHVADPQYCWAVCNQAKGWSYKPTRANLPRDTYPYLISRLHVIIYNGDSDACVPYVDNAAWTENMGLTPTSAWKAWYYQDAYNSTQIGGYAVTYDTSSLTGYSGPDVSSFEFRTVRGAGHMVPTDTPVQGLAILARLVGQTASMYYYPADDSADGDTMSCPQGGNRSLAQLIVFIFLFLTCSIVSLYLFREVKRLRVAVAINSRDLESMSAHGLSKIGGSRNPMYVGVSGTES
jgi:carboxypeptidase C (cathepsin A)